MEEYKRSVVYVPSSKYIGGSEMILTPTVDM